MRVDNSNYLAHYGVMGMRWGKRKGIQRAKDNYKKANEAANKKYGAAEDSLDPRSSSYVSRMDRADRDYKTDRLRNKRDYKIAKVKAGQDSYRNLNKHYEQQARGRASSARARLNNIKATVSMDRDSMAYLRGVRKWRKNNYKKGIVEGIRKDILPTNKEWAEIDRYYTNERKNDSQKYTAKKIAKGEKKIKKIRAKYDRKISKLG